MKKTSGQRHAALINALADLYTNEDGTPYFTMRPDGINSGTAHDLNYNELNSAVALVVDLFHMTGGSIGNMDLYRLLQAYITMPESRDAINEEVAKAHSRKYAELRS